MQDEKLEQKYPNYYLSERKKKRKREREKERVL